MEVFVLHARSGTYDMKSFRVVAVTGSLDEAIEFAYEDMQDALEHTDQEEWPMFTEVPDYDVNVVDVGDWGGCPRYSYHPNDCYSLVWDERHRRELRDRDFAWFRAQWTASEA